MSCKSVSKSQLRKLTHPRSSPYSLGKGSSAHSSRRAPDTNDYSQKFHHGWMYIRDKTKPMIHYRIGYSIELELWLLSHCPVDPLNPPRYSPIRTCNHPTHRILGADVKSFHQLKDSGFRYQEKFPSCLRICLSGMGRSGSSNRPYVLSEKDFAYHFAQIANAHTGNKKAKLCLYEHESHRPRIEWLKQMTKLVFGGDYDHKRYQVRQMHFDGNRLIEANSVSPTNVSPPPLVSLLECDEELSDEDDHESVAHTIVQENMHDINQQHPSSAHTHDSTSNDEDAHTEDESRSTSLAASTRLASLPLPPPPSTSSTGLPLASPACSPSSVSHLQLLPFPSNFNLFAADSFVPQSNSSACLSRAPSTSSIAYMKLPSSFPVRLSSNELFTEPTLLIDSNNSSTAVTSDKFPSTVERTHSEARLDSTAFQWLHANSNGVQMATSITSTNVPQPSSSTLSTHLSIPVQVQLAPSCSPFLSPVAMQRFSSIDSIGQFLVDEGSRAAYCEQQITNA